MVKFDLNNIPAEYNTNINEISRKIIPEFNLLIKKIWDNSNKNLSFQLHPLIGRNPFQSDLFNNLVILIFAKNFIDANKDLIEVKVQNIVQLKILNLYTKNRNIKIKNENSNKSILLINIKSFLRLLRRSFRYIFSKNKTRKLINVFDKKITIIDTFLLENSLINKRYIDRYYNHILNYIDKTEIDSIYWLPTIITSRLTLKKSLLDKIKLNSTQNIIYKQDYLSFVDYFLSIYSMINFNPLRSKYFLFSELDISILIDYEYRKHKFYYPTFEGLLNYRFMNKLSKANIDLKLVIDWHENQPNDKGLIKGVHDYFPGVLVKGYQGFIIDFNFNQYLIPLQFEIDSGVIPDQIVVVGKKLVKYLSKFKSDINVDFGPALRFSNNVINSQNNFTLLILPMGIDESYDLIFNIVKSLNNLKNHNIKIKAHPTTNVTILKNMLERNNLNYFTFVNSDFSSVLKNSILVIGSGSSALIESLCNGIPVIVIPNSNGFINNPIPEDVNNTIYKICFNLKDLQFLIKSFLEDFEEKHILYKKIGIQIRKDYLEKPSKININKFLNIN